MATIAPHPSALPPMPTVARILSGFDRAQLAGFIEVAISLLDAGDGDPDLEPNGDEQDGSYCAEDEFMQLHSDGPGCPIADPGGCEHDGREPEDGV
jgi:hypothetical protein